MISSSNAAVLPSAISNLSETTILALAEVGVTRESLPQLSFDERTSKIKAAGGKLPSAGPRGPKPNPKAHAVASVLIDTYQRLKAVQVSCSACGKVGDLKTVANAVFDRCRIGASGKDTIDTIIRQRRLAGK